MERWFDRIGGRIDVQHISRSVHLLLFGLGRFGHIFALLAAYHGVRWIRAVDSDWVSRENFASGVRESAVGTPKVAEMADELRRQSSRISFEGAALDLSADDPTPNKIGDWLSRSTHVAIFIDSFDVTSALAKAIYPHRPCIFATILEGGRTGESAWSNPGQTPCLECTVSLSKKRGERGGQTLLVDVFSTVTVAFRQFMGLCLVGRRGFDLFAPYVDPRFCLAVTINGPGGFLEMAPGRQDIPSGVRLVEVIPENGRGPSCSICRGYRP